MTQVREVVAAGADLVLLDNMSLDELREAVRGSAGAAGVLTEASGGLSLDVARAVAETGVDFLAVGALTHSAPVLDLGVDLRMLLTVDVGNTNTVLGLFDGDELFESYRIKTDPRVTADELALMFRGLLAAHPAPDGVSVCSTVPAVLDAAAGDVRALLRRRADRSSSGRVCAPACPCSTTTRARSAPTGSSTRSPRTRSTAARRSSSTSAPRPTSTSCRRKGEFLGGALAPGVEISRRRPGRARRPAVQGRARRAALGHRQDHQRGAAERAGLRLRRAGRRHGRGGSPPSWAPSPVVIATGGLSHLMFERLRDASTTTSRT